MTKPASNTTVYTISASSGAGATLAAIRAASVEAAAGTYARRQYRNAVVLRTTGTPGLSGVFQAYTPVRGGALTSRGGAFHVG